LARTKSIMMTLTANNQGKELVLCSMITIKINVY